MKRITAIILLAFCALLMFTACNGNDAGGTVESMVSTMMPTDNSNNNGDNNMQNDGTVTDGDGVIGNEDNQNNQGNQNNQNNDNSAATTATSTTANGNNNVADNNVL